MPSLNIWFIIIPSVVVGMIVGFCIGWEVCRQHSRELKDEFLSRFTERHKRMLADAEHTYRSRNLRIRGLMQRSLSTPDPDWRKIAEQIVAITKEP